MATLRYLSSNPKSSAVRAPGLNNTDPRFDMNDSELVRHAFEHLNPDEDGYVSRREFQIAMQNSTSELHALFGSTG